MDSWVLSIGAGDEQLHGIEVAKKNGYKVLAVDRNPNSAGSKKVDRFYPIDTCEKELILQLAKKYEVKAIIASPLGKSLTTVGFVNEALGLYGPHFYECDICTNKDKFYAALLHHNIKTPQTFKVDRDISKSTSEFNYPIIIKPTFGSGSRGVLLLQNEDELKSALVYNSHIYKLGFILQSYVKGTSYGVDGIITNGNTEVVCTRKKTMTPPPYLVETSYLAPGITDEEVSKMIKLELQKLVNILKVRNSLFHADLIIDLNGDPYIIEFSPRPSGLKISSKLVPLSTNRDLIEEFFNLSNGILCYPKAGPSSYYLLQYLEFDEGQIITHSKTENKVSCKNIVDYSINFETATEYKRPKDIQDLVRYGYFIIRGETEKEVKEFSSKILGYMK